MSWMGGCSSGKAHRRTHRCVSEWLSSRNKDDHDIKMAGFGSSTSRSHKFEELEELEKPVMLTSSYRYVRGKWTNFIFHHKWLPD